MPSVAFFGATGGCAGHCLAFSLKAGYDCTALARTPAKLTEAMKTKGVSAESLDSHLTVIQGDVRDIEAVKRTLQLPNGAVVEDIVSGIGTYPRFAWSLWRPLIQPDATLCRDAVATILRALQQLKPSKKPLFINMTTTGISSPGKPRDVPVLFVPLYHWLLAAPHEDKRGVVELLAEHVRLPVGERGIEGYVNVKASLLTDGEGTGLQAVREGVEEKPAVGYMIARQDVGLWVFERLIKSETRAEWMCKSASITY
ncbi:hypothetical protein LTR36_007898 [Oleoguttula mirabilis]|uniref:NAD(P)-binding domain-containing protein n=1 Tax=Oleoguttula mirabilis TaxID=1507867 RepID=A0AAV9J9M0_9PEZI|nr:hypothetical protein LTR36_007898 [Oleoguttula mirabilis]